MAVNLQLYMERDCRYLVHFETKDTTLMNNQLIPYRVVIFHVELLFYSGC